MTIPNLNAFVQNDIVSGGMHTAPEARLLLYALCVSLGAKEVLELGFDAGWTTEVLAKSGAHVTAIDNNSEYPKTTALARARLASYTNCDLLETDAIEFLIATPDDFYDFIFIDDSHEFMHVTVEAYIARLKIKSGGIIAFHDTNIHRIWQVIEEVFRDWQRINLPAWSPQYSRADSGSDFGLGIVRRPLT